MTRSALAAASLPLAAACAGASPDSTPPAASPAAPPSASSEVSSGQPSALPIHSLLASDTGRRFTAAPGTAVDVRLAGSATWGPLTATIGSVEEVLYRTDPGFREWQVTLPAAGEVVLTATCPDCVDQQQFQVTIVVR